MHHPASPACAAAPFRAHKNAIIARLLSGASDNDLAAMFAGIDRAHLQSIVAFASYELDERDLGAVSA